MTSIHDMALSQTSRYDVEDRGHTAICTGCGEGHDFRPDLVKKERWLTWRLCQKCHNSKQTVKAKKLELALERMQ